MEKNILEEELEQKASQKEMSRSIIYLKSKTLSPFFKILLLNIMFFYFIKTSLNDIDIKKLLDDFLNFNLKGFELNSSAVLAFASSCLFTAFSSLSLALSGVTLTLKVLLIGLVPLLNSIYSYTIFKNGLIYSLSNILVANLMVSIISSIIFLIVFLPIDLMSYILVSLKKEKE